MMKILNKISDIVNIEFRIIFIVLLLTIVGCEKSDSDRQNVTNKNANLVQEIPYKIARKWTIPNGGYGKEIAINNKNDRFIYKFRY